MRFSDRAKYWSEWQDLNLRSIVPNARTRRSDISKRKSPETAHVAERHSNDWFGAVWSSRAGPLRLNAAPIQSDINSGSKSVPSRSWPRWDLVKNTPWDSMVRSRSHFANKYLKFVNNGSPPLGINAPTDSALAHEQHEIARAQPWISISEAMKAARRVASISGVAIPRGGGVLDITAVSPLASCGLPARWRETRFCGARIMLDKSDT